MEDSWGTQDLAIARVSCVVAVAKQMSKGPLMDGQGSGRCIDQDHGRQNYVALPSALAAEERDDGVGGCGQLARGLDPRAMTQSSHEYGVDDRRPWVREVYVRACDDSRPVRQVVEDHLGTDQVMT